MTKFKDLSEEDKARFLNEHVYYEMLFTFGIPRYDSSDYAQWEAVNYARFGHARCLKTFLTTPVGKRDERYKDDVVAADYGFTRYVRQQPKDKEKSHCPIDIPDELWDQVNKSLMHLSTGRLHYKERGETWPTEYIENLIEPCIDFINHVLGCTRCVDKDERKEKWELLRTKLQEMRNEPRAFFFRGDVDKSDDRIYYHYVDFKSDVSFQLPPSEDVRILPPLVKTKSDSESVTFIGASENSCNANVDVQQ